MNPTQPPPFPDFRGAALASARVCVLALSPRVGLSYLACQSATRILEDVGAAPSFASTVDLTIVAAGLDDVPGYVAPPQVRALDGLLATSDAVVLGVPVHRSAVAGVSRNWIELLRGGIAGKPVLPIVAAGSSRAHLAAVAFRADLYLNFGAHPLPPVVVTPDERDEDAEQRLASSLAELLAATAPGLAPADTLVVS